MAKQSEVNQGINDYIYHLAALKEVEKARRWFKVAFYYSRDESNYNRMDVMDHARNELELALSNVVI